MGPAYDAIQSCVEKKLKPEVEWCFEYFDSAALQRVIDEQAAIIKIMKEEVKKRYGIAVVLDDFADSREVTWNSRLLCALTA